MADIAIGGRLNCSVKSASVDLKYGPYPSKQAAFETLGEDGMDALAVGLTVGIEEDGKVVEYWFESACESVDDLVKKIDGGGSEVSVQQTLTSGTEIAKVSVDGSEVVLYAPAPTSVAVETISGEKVKIATIGGVDVYAPKGVTLDASDVESAVNDYFAEHGTPTGVSASGVSTNEEGVSVQDKLNVYDDDFYTTSIGEEITHTAEYTGKGNLSGSTSAAASDYLVANAAYTTREYVVNGLETVYITGRQPGVGTRPIIVAFDSSNNATPVFGEMGVTYKGRVINIPRNSVKIRISMENGNPSLWTSVKKLKVALSEDVYTKEQSDTRNDITYLKKEDYSIVQEEEYTNKYIEAGLTTTYVSKTQAVGATVAFSTMSGTGYFKYKIPVDTKVIVNIKSGGAYGFAHTDLDDKVISFASTGTAAKQYVIEPQLYETYLYASKIKIESVIFFVKKDMINNIFDNVNKSNYWDGKAIWWCGTSIPAGSDVTLGSAETVAGMYPKQVGFNLNATVFNEAVGGSMCRANVRTGDYNGVNHSNLTSCLSRTKAEIEDIITNYSTYRALSNNTAWPASLSSTDLSRLRASSFEDKVLPYLTGEVNGKNPKGLNQTSM